MYSILKTVAAAATPTAYPFTYARQDFANLFDEVEATGLPHIFLDSVKVSESYDNYDNLIEKTYTGSFMIVVSSDIDEGDYNTRYTNRIKPILDATVDEIRIALHVADWIKINGWDITEVINMFGYGFDGVLIDFNIVEDTQRTTAQ